MESMEEQARRNFAQTGRLRIADIPFVQGIEEVCK